MKKLLNNLKSSSGFTLIELLVVIGILGILASALVATIDPFEQLNKAQDANVKNALVEYLNADVRYFTTHNAMPWAATPDGAGCNNASFPSGSALTNPGPMKDCTDALVSEGELKAAFGTYNGLSKIFITADSDNNVTGCFKPASKSQQKDPQTKFTDATGLTVGTTCKSQVAQNGVDCYWCTQ